MTWSRKQIEDVAQSITGVSVHLGDRLVETYTPEQEVGVDFPHDIAAIQTAVIAFTGDESCCSNPDCETYGADWVSAYTLSMSEARTLGEYLVKLTAGHDSAPHSMVGYK